ncbi:MAG: prepilin-type N-terminal cleavage/methylation domain-containing protein [Pelobacteraceae bacterium]
MKEKAFTLIEIMVVMAIISVLAGIMAPAVWKFWEGEEIATTRERMREIKKGLVGDKSLVQNGVRTHYGFVGDNGELPFTNISAAGGLSYLVSKPVGGYPHWNGPYLTGFGSEWNKDAWGNTFRYTLTKDAYGRYVSAELRSAGLDGVFDTPDDIVDPDVQVYDRDVTPTNRIRIQGNILNNYSGGLKITLKFKDPTDPTGIYSQPPLCKQLKKASGFSNYTTLLLDSSLNPLKLPVGGIEITTTLHHSTDCTDSLPSTNNFLYFVSDNINQIILPELR